MPLVFLQKNALMAEYLELHPVDPQPRLIRRAADVVRGGGLIAYPTDSCYAFGWHIGDKHALERVRRIRQADRHHHFTLVCANLAEVGRFARLEDIVDFYDKGMAYLKRKA